MCEIYDVSFLANWVTVLSLLVYCYCLLLCIVRSLSGMAFGVGLGFLSIVSELCITNWIRSLGGWIVEVVIGCWYRKGNTIFLWGVDGWNKNEVRWYQEEHPAKSLSTSHRLWLRATGYGLPTRPSNQYQYVYVCVLPWPCSAVSQLCDHKITFEQNDLWSTYLQ